MAELTIVSNNMKRSPATFPYGYGAIARQYSEYENSKVVIIPFPYDSTSSYKTGTREGPAAIIQASRNLELYDEEAREEIGKKIGIHTFDEIQPSLESLEGSVRVIEKIVLDVVKASKFPVILGGEHTISIGSVRALKKRHKSLSVLQLDAHPDLMNYYQNTQYSHACTMRRISEICSFAQIGIRCFSKSEHGFIKSNNIDSVSVLDYLKNNNIIDRLLAKLEDNIYITIDLDVFDPSEMPSVGTPEPGGFRWYDILSILRKVAQKKNVVGFDVVELTPIPGNIASDFLAAKLVYKVLGYIFCKRRKDL